MNFYQKTSSLLILGLLLLLPKLAARTINTAVVENKIEPIDKIIEEECINFAPINITRKSTAFFYLNDDVAPEKSAQYALYEIENTGSNTIDAYVKADNFVGAIRLADNESGIYHIGTLASGEKGHAYIYIGTDLAVSGQNQVIPGTNTHDINVYNGDPSNGGTLAETVGFDITTIEDVIKANANKVEGLTVSGSTELGNTFAVTVTGKTGTIGAAKIANFTAATNMDWPASSFKLINTSINFSKISGGNGNDGLVKVNELNFIMPDTKNTAYEVVYTFLVVAATDAVAGYEPVSYISSGTQIKHSILDNGVSVPAIPKGSVDPVVETPTSAKITGFVWSDLDYDGIKQAGESKMNGVKVRLLDEAENQLQSTTSSGSTGDYEFTVTTAGNYKIRFDRNDRFVATKQNTGGVDLSSHMNRATRIVDLTVVLGENQENINAGFTPDFDRDLIPDIVEINGGVTNYEEVDPAGYIYDEATGEILPDGYIMVTGPGAINIVDTGNVTGYYSWLIDGTPGTYTMTVTPPPNYELSTTRLPSATLDPTGLTPDPYSIGSPDVGADGYLDNFTFAANTFYMTFDLAAGDPFVIDNNIPLKVISTSSAPTVDSICTNENNYSIYVHPIENATGHDWMIPNGATYTQLPGDTTILIDWTTTTGNLPRLDSIGIVGTNNCAMGDTIFTKVYLKNCNNNPIALADTAFTDENIAIIIPVQLNDTDMDGDDLTTTLVGVSAQGITASIENGDSISYTPPLNFIGKDTLSYSICDNGVTSLCDTAQVFITIQEINVNPTAINDVDTTFYQTDSSHLVLLNDSDANGDDLSITGVGTDAIDGLTANGGTVSINDNGTPANTTDDYINYTPPTGFSGTDTFQYTISDGLGGVATATVTYFIYAPTETNCTDNLDDDGDGLIDCLDPDCLPAKATNLFKG